VAGPPTYDIAKTRFKINPLSPIIRCSLLGLQSVLHILFIYLFAPPQKNRAYYKARTPGRTDHFGINNSTQKDGY